MKKTFIPIIAIGCIILIGFLWTKNINNTAVQLNENVYETWGNVQTSYQRRNDLIGNLVKTVQGAADFEKSTLTAVVEARAKATSTTIDINHITPEQLTEFNKIQGGLSNSLSRLLVSVEKYPDLKTNENFLKLQDELTSTENTIQTARTRFNEAIKIYNTHVKTFPNSIFAKMFGFEGKPYFDAEVGTEKAPDINFDMK